MSLRPRPGTRRAPAAPHLSETAWILVAVNGYPDGWEALGWAAVEAWARRTPLRIVHVFRWPPLTLDPYGALVANQWEAAAAEAARLVLDEAAARARIVARHLEITCQALAGAPAAAILRSAPAQGLIVLGRGRRGALPSLFSGSVRRKVARRAVVPVVVAGLSP